MRFVQIIPFIAAIAVFVAGCGEQREANADSVSKRVPAANIPKPSWASAIGQDQFGRWADIEIGGATQRFRFIPAGSFTMGCNDAETDAAWNERKQVNPEFLRELFIAPQHVVTLTHAFWLAESACTEALWQAVMNKNPSHHMGDLQRPVEQVSWIDTQGFCIALNRKLTGAQTRLPSEAEWEYACRAGTTGPYNGPTLDAVGWYVENSGRMTHPVKQKKPNAWGLYDMHGNVWQWCADWIGDYPDKAVSDPIGPASESDRVARGGGWGDELGTCRSAMRGRGAPDLRVTDRGFRLCLSAQSEP
jgi:sulfatase modifying factor 1